MEFTIEFQDFDWICRFCLKRPLFLKPIFGNKDHIVEDNHSNNQNAHGSINEMIENCTRIQMSPTDSLPKSICSECLNLLLMCNQFREQCTKSDEVLKSIIHIDEKVANKYEHCNVEEFGTNIENLIKVEIYVKDGELEEGPEMSTQLNPIKPNAKDPLLHEKDFKNGKIKKKQIKYKKNNEIKSKPKKSRKKVGQKLEINLKQCQVCGIMSERIHKHMRTHSGEKNFKCTLCDRSYGQKCHLTTHIRNIHLNHREYKCDLCDKAFNSAKSLKIHYVRHTGEMSFVCDICNRAFRYRTTLSRHKLTHFENRRYECDTCHKCFYTKSCLTKHNRIHSGERPFQCEYCPKRFISSGNLIIHKKGHTNGAPYKCSICENNFIYKVELVEHLCKVHSLYSSTR